MPRVGWRARSLLREPFMSRMRCPPSHPQKRMGRTMGRTEMVAPNQALGIGRPNVPTPRARLARCARWRAPARPRARLARRYEISLGRMGRWDGRNSIKDLHRPIQAKDGTVMGRVVEVAWRGCFAFLYLSAQAVSVRKQPRQASTRLTRPPFPVPFLMPSRLGSGPRAFAPIVKGRGFNWPAGDADVL
jgi:hypothetical protein